MSRNSYLTALFILFAFSLTIYFKLNLTLSEKKILPPPSGLEFYHFGYNEVMADFLWLTYVQQSWNCYMAKNCHKNWGFRVLDEASMLAPKFKSLYIYGATGLSILLDDDYGAKEIFDRGLAEYPEDWVLNYRAGYHYLIELENDIRAAQLLNTAGDHGAPFWTKSLAAKLYAKNGNFEASEILIQSMIVSTEDSFWKKNLEERLIEVRNKKAKAAQVQNLK